MMDAYTQTLQDQIGQLSKLLGAQPTGQQIPMQTTAQAANQYDLVTGLDGAKAFMSKMLANSRHIVWDNEKPVFYVLEKDANGVAKRVQICTFTVELEPSPEDRFVSKEEFNAMMSKLDQLLKEKESKPTIKNKEGVNNG